MNQGKAKKRRVVELDELRNRLREAEETLSAIRSGEVDALIVNGPSGDQVFSLKGAEQPYRVFVEQMQQGALTLSAEGTILFCNRRFAELIRRPLERVIGIEFTEFVCPQDRATLPQLLLEAETSKSPAPLRLMAADGATVSVSISVNSLPLDDLHATCIVVTDLTEQEELIAAEQANQAKDQFLAALSHELRTPLTPVLMIVASLEQDDRLPQDVRDELVDLRRSVELEARLIDDLLDLTRIAKGKIELHIADVDIEEFLTVVLKMCESDIHAKNLKLEIRNEAASTYVRGDGVRLQQIIWNLMRNAIKFTPPGGRISVVSRTDGDMLAIEIADTGIGIAPESLSKIFMPFEQASRLITRKFGGLGLGLTISKRLAEMQGGTIYAHSPGVNQGATFTLQLLLAQPNLSSTEGHVDIAGCEGAANPSADKLRVLLVEDHSETAVVLERLLARAGHHVKVARNIATALELAAAVPFDVIVSDIGLPDGTGHDLMRQIKEKYQIPGVALTGYGMEDDLARSRDAGFVAHVVKPVNLVYLQAVIGRAVRR